MPERPTIKAGDPGCQADQDAYVSEQERLLQKRISFVCQDCGDDFTETLEALVFSSVTDEIQAPALCVRCGHGAEDE